MKERRAVVAGSLMGGHGDAVSVKRETGKIIKGLGKGSDVRVIGRVIGRGAAWV